MKPNKFERKVTTVMGEFGKGALHSGSKHGPIVENPKQARAIALSVARKKALQGALQRKLAK